MEEGVFLFFNGLIEKQKKTVERLEKKHGKSAYETCEARLELNIIKKIAKKAKAANLLSKDWVFIK